MAFHQRLPIIQSNESLTAKAKEVAILCWAKWHSFSYPLELKELQKHLVESHELASKFVLNARQTLTGPNRHPDFILNVDQTPISFSLHGKLSWDSNDTCTIDICKTTDNTSSGSSAPFLNILCLQKMDGQASHEGLSGTKPQAACVQKTGWDCPHSFMELVV